ncbi:uncharacterized protein LOC62_02G002573 [Vanrija pseudolonga]|uniref:RNase III domain-containing protein n=1 Tax=Vanrija pseudolonga TaxID=143232 RepID=A0AAF0Y7B3_9TREE|nr:hypothetical protein LOC62_02G002573 [Vanrija pseudolonga]
MAVYVVENAPFKNITYKLPQLPKGVLRKTLTHRTVGGYKASYEALEFIGDGYLEAAAKHLVGPWQIGASAKHTIVTLMARNSTIAQITIQFGLHEKIRIHPNEHPTSHQWTKIYGDVFEAFIAAYWEAKDVKEGLNFTVRVITPICLWMKDELEKGNLWSREWTPK